MFVEYCIAQGFILQPLVSIVAQFQEPLPSQKQEQNSKPDQNFICLTQEDHVKAGYDKIKKPWTQEEDKLLKQLRDKKNFQWDQIAKVLPGRNAKMCYSRYKRLDYNPREHWKPSEDDLLRSMVARYGEDWAVIVPHFKNRSAKQVKDHYINYLKFNVSRDNWTLEEDMRLVELLNKHGRNWKSIQEGLNGRTQNQIKNRYFGRIKKLHDKKMNELTKQEAIH